jgi:hypothetical protein
MAAVFGPAVVFHHLSQMMGQGGTRILGGAFSTIHYVTFFGGSFVLVYLSNQARRDGAELAAIDRPMSSIVPTFIAYSIPPAAYIACGSLLSLLSSGQFRLP